MTVDGSPDDWRAAVSAIKVRDARVTVIELSRNFGHHAAMWCSLEHSTGDLVFMIDSDLEVAPAILSDLNGKLQADPDLDVAFAYQSERGGNLQTALFGRVFWGIFRVLSSVDIPPNVLTERLMRRAYVDALLRLGDRNLFLAGMMYWAGFKQVGVPTVKRPRTGSSYSLMRRLLLATEAITSFSNVPMQLLFAFGFLVAGASLLGAVLLIVRKILNPNTVLQGFTFLSVLLILSLGVITGSIGLLGIYIGKIFVQTRGRPVYVVKRVL